jgi:hypothetical protein
MMIRCRLSVVASALAAVVLAALTSYGAEAPAQQATHGLVLKYHQTEGDRAAYDFSATGVAKLNVQKGLTTEKINVNLQMKCVEEFWEPTSDGLIQVQGAILSGTIKAIWQGEEEAQPVERTAVNYKIASSGEMQEQELLSGEPLILPGMFIVFGPDDAFLIGGRMQFPKKPLKVGDKWKGTVRIPTLESGQTILADYESKVLGLEQYRGRPCVKIKTTSKYSEKETAPVPESGGTATGKVTTAETQTWRFDYERGLVMSSEGTIQATLTGTFVDEEAREYTATMSGVVNTRSKMTEFNGQALPAK